MADLVHDWILAWAEWADANAAGSPVRVRNQIMDRVWRLGREIAGHTELHPAIEALCDIGQEAEVRLHAALVREHWDVDGAAETLESVITDSGTAVLRPVTMSAALSVDTSKAARTAALCLFNIDSGRGNTGVEH